MNGWNIVIVDAEVGRPVGSLLRKILEIESRYRVELVQSPLPHQKPPHLWMPVVPEETAQAQTLLKSLRDRTDGVPVLPVIAAEALPALIDDLADAGVDFLLTPLREREVHVRVRRALQLARDARDTASSDQELAERGLAQLIGEDRAFAAVRRKIQMAAQSDSTVLLNGETGTGKERCARALHYCSRRAGKPFLPVNCGAIPADLFENELFGHQSGAFTGAMSTQTGLIAEAEGGTLFLDEIETLGIGSQVKLLRFLQDQTYYALGSAKARQANVWIIASSNVDLIEKARTGTFREDLFYRLAVITLRLPPLRERTQDIPLLANHFLRLYGDRFGKDQRRFSAGATETLCKYSWPGNVRELENLVQQVLVLTDSAIIEPADLPLPACRADAASTGSTFRESKAEAVARFERHYLTGVLRAHHGNVTHAATAAGMERRAFGRLIKKHQIEK